MPERVHQTTRYGLGTEPVAGRGEPSGMSAGDEERYAVAHPVADTRDQGVPDAGDDDDGPDAARLQASFGESATWQASGAQDCAVDETTEFVRSVPVEEETKQPKLGAVASQRRGASSYMTGVSIGVVLVGAGFGAILWTWTNVASLVNVAQQMPYVVSGGISGLVLVIIGATVVDVAERRRDSRERTEQLAEVARALAAVRELMVSEPQQREVE